MRKSNHTPDIRRAPGSKVLKAARKLGLGASQAAAGLLSPKASRRIGERWNEENREAISEYNSRIALEGLPLEKYRTF